MINSMLKHYDAYGLLPVWELAGNETFCMIGNHAIPVITEAYLKGIRNFDVEKAYEAMKKRRSPTGPVWVFTGNTIIFLMSSKTNRYPKRSNMLTMTGVSLKWPKPCKKEDDYLFLFKRLPQLHQSFFDPGTGLCGANLLPENGKHPSPRSIPTTGTMNIPKVTPGNIPGWCNTMSKG